MTVWLTGASRLNCIGVVL